ncbi:hypothetical protein ABVT39_016590 [Epinephelus coioides]
MRANPSRSAAVQGAEQLCLVNYLICQEVSSLLTCDRQRFFDQLKYDPLVSSPPCLDEIPVFLRRPPLYLAGKKHHRRCGKQGGLRVRLKAHLRSVCVSDRCSDLHFRDVPPALRSWRTKDQWIRPMFPDVGGSDSISCSTDPDQLLLPPTSWRVRTGRHGEDRRNLHSLKRASSSLTEACFILI